MRRLFLVSLLFLGTPLLSKADPDGTPGLVVHEWGVWRVHEEADLANADIRDVWENLPSFVYGQVDGRKLPKRWPNIVISDKPVLFFHTPKACELTLRIDFPRGVPGVWWPATWSPAIETRGGRVPIEVKKELARHLEWHLSVVNTPPGPRDASLPRLEKVDERHWVKVLREVEAADVVVKVGEEGVGAQREHFVYYDGLLPRGRWLTLETGKGNPRLTNIASFPVFDVTLIDRRGPGKVLVGRLAKLESGATGQEVELRETTAERWGKEAPKTLQKQLRDAGLFADEAGSLVELWKRELFESEGMTLFYRFPQEEYERQLPMILRPRPEKLVRVGLAVHPHCEPDLAKRVAELVRDLGSDEFEVRQKAENRLIDMGRAAFGPLVKLRKTATDPEVRVRLNRVLSRIESARALGG
jgi:hypothetical protein